MVFCAVAVKIKRYIKPSYALTGFFSMDELEKALKKLIDRNRIKANIKVADPDRGSVLELSRGKETRIIRLLDNSSDLSINNR